MPRTTLVARPYDTRKFTYDKSRIGTDTISWQPSAIA